MADNNPSTPSTEAIPHQAAFPRVWIRTWRLEMSSYPTTPHRAWPAEAARVERWRDPTTEAYLALYHRVGDAFGWGSGRLLMDRTTLKKTLESVEIYRLRVGDEVVGFAELQRSVCPSTASSSPEQPQREEQVQIKYFGLVEAHFGRGLGSAFLRYAVACAFRAPLPDGYPPLCDSLGESTATTTLLSDSIQVKRLWLTTCENDHPSTQHVYESAGFTKTDCRRLCEACPVQYLRESGKLDRALPSFRATALGSEIAKQAERYHFEFFSKRDNPTSEHERVSSTSRGFVNHAQLAATAAALLGADNAQVAEIAEFYVRDMLEQPLTVPARAPQPAPEDPPSPTDEEARAQLVRDLLGGGKWHGLLFEHYQSLVARERRPCDALQTLLPPLAMGAATSLFHGFVLASYAVELHSVLHDRDVSESLHACLDSAVRWFLAVGLTVMHMRYTPYGQLPAAESPEEEAAAEAALQTSLETVPAPWAAATLATEEDLLGWIGQTAQQLVDSERFEAEWLRAGGGVKPYFALQDAIAKQAGFQQLLVHHQLPKGACADREVLLGALARFVCNWYRLHGDFVALHGLSSVRALVAFSGVLPSDEAFERVAAGVWSALLGIYAVYVRTDRTDDAFLRDPLQRTRARAPGFTPASLPCAEPDADPRVLAASLPSWESLCDQALAAKYSHTVKCVWAARGLAARVPYCDAFARCAAATALVVVPL